MMLHILQQDDYVMIRENRELVINNTSIINVII